LDVIIIIIIDIIGQVHSHITHAQESLSPSGYS